MLPIKLVVVAIVVAQLKLFECIGEESGENTSERRKDNKKRETISRRQLKLRQHMLPLLIYIND